MKRTVAKVQFSFHSSGGVYKWIFPGIYIFWENTKLTKETWPLKKMYISCTDSSCHNWFPDFLLVRQNSFTTAHPMNCQNKLVWQLGFVHKINIHLEAMSPFFSTFPCICLTAKVKRGGQRIQRKREKSSFLFPS